MDFKNERKLRQKKKKFEKSKEVDGDKSNQAQLEESPENAEERYVDTNFEYCSKFRYWLKNTGSIPSLGFLFLKVLCFPITPGTYFWGMLQSFAISKLLRITVLTFLFESNSLLNTGLVSAITITLGHKHKEPPGGSFDLKTPSQGGRGKGGGLGYFNLKSTGKWPCPF